jgi:hypothetical protein
MANEFKIKNGYLSEGNSQITGSLNVSGGITGSLFGTASYATTTISASYAVTASYATNALSASYAPGGASTPAFPFTGSAGITGSLTVVGKTQSTQIGAGAAPSGSVPLDVKAQGALSTDIALRVRNSVDSLNILKLAGNHTLNMLDSAGRTMLDVAISAFTVGEAGHPYLTDGAQAITIASLTKSQIIGQIGGWSAYNEFSFTNTSRSTTNMRLNNAINLGATGVGSSYTTIPYKQNYVCPIDYFGTAGDYAGGFMWYKGTTSGNPFVTKLEASITSSNLLMQLTPEGALHFKNTTPTYTGSTNSFQLYSSASTAGNAKPYFRTENGTVVYLGDQSLLYNVTASSIVSSFTGSLLGTASYAPPAFPYTGSATVLGSLVVNDNATTSSLNTSARVLRDTSNRISLGWDNRGLVRSNGAISVDWENNTLKRSNITTLDWSDKITYDTSTSSSIKWDTRELWDGDPTTVGYNTASLDWNNRRALGAAADVSIDWASRRLYDHNAAPAIGWDGRVLATPSGYSALAWTSDYHLNSNLYQTDIKLVELQESVSNNFSNTDESYFGDIIEVDGSRTFLDVSVTDGMLVYLNATTWYPVDQTDNTHSTYMLGIAFGVGLRAGYVLLEGHVVISQSSTAGPYIYHQSVAGCPIYIKSGTTAGLMSADIPTSNIVRVLGHTYFNSAGDPDQWMMKFRPSNDWVTI